MLHCIDVTHGNADKNFTHKFHLRGSIAVQVAKA